MGETKFRTPTLAKPLNQFGWRFKYIITSAQGVDVQNVAEINAAVMNLRMREKRVFVWIFFVNISIYLSQFSSGLQVTFLGRF